MQEQEIKKYWVLKNGIWIGWGVSTLYVTIILFWSLLNKNHMLYLFDLMSPVSDFISIFIPIINKHSSQLFEHGYMFEASRSRNIYSIIWIISFISFLFTLVYTYSGNRFVKKRNKIPLKKLFLVQIGLLTAFGIVSFYGVDIDFNLASRRSYALHRTSFFYFIQSGCVCVIMALLAMIFEQVCDLIRRNSSGR